MQAERYGGAYAAARLNVTLSRRWTGTLYCRYLPRLTALRTAAARCAALPARALHYARGGATYAPMRRPLLPRYVSYLSAMYKPGARQHVPYLYCFSALLRLPPSLSPAVGGRRRRGSDAGGRWRGGADRKR